MILESPDHFGNLHLTAYVWRNSARDRPPVALPVRFRSDSVWWARAKEEMRCTSGLRSPRTSTLSSSAMVATSLLPWTTPIGLAGPRVPDRPEEVLDPCGEVPALRRGEVSPSPDTAPNHASGGKPIALAIAPIFS